MTFKIVRYFPGKLERTLKWGGGALGLAGVLGGLGMYGTRLKNDTFDNLSFFKKAAVWFSDDLTNLSKLFRDYSTDEAAVTTYAASGLAALFGTGVYMLGNKLRRRRRKRDLELLREAELFN